MSDKVMKLLTPARVAEILGFTPRTITRWCREGRFPTAHKVGRVWRLEWNDVELHLMVYRKNNGIQPE